MNRLKVIAVLVGLVVAVVLLWLAVRQFGLIGGLVLAPVAAAGAVLNEVAKVAGAAELPKPIGKPRRGSVAASSGEPKQGKRRTRPRRGGFGKWG